MKLYFKSVWSPRPSATLVMTGLCLLGCDSSLVLDGHESETEQGLSLVMDNSTPSVRLVDGYTQDHREFADIDEFFEAVDAAEDDDRLTLDTKLYGRLAKALVPAEISLLDNSGSVTIGRWVYEATRLFVQRRPIASSGAAWELVEYWGEDGLAMGHELSRVFEAMGDTSALSATTFMNPYVKAVANELRLGQGGIEPATYDYRFVGPVTICLPDAEVVEGVDTQCYSVKYLLWNESTGRFRRKAYAGTSGYVLIGSTYVAFGHYSVPTDVYLGLGLRARLKVTVDGGKGRKTQTCTPIMSRGPLDYSRNPPYEWISGAQCYSAMAQAKRKSGRGATSFHGGGEHDYFAKTWVSAYNRYYLLYSATAYWHYSNEYLH